MTKEVERLWPELFNTYLAKFKESSDALGTSWQQLHDRISTMSSHVGSEFAESTQTLSESVDKLVKLTAESSRVAPR